MENHWSGGGSAEVDEQRTLAYRRLLYCAMLQIRGLEGFGWRRRDRRNPFYWRRQVRWVQYAGAIANWLHNLAHYSSVNFQGFNEEWFWRDFESLQTRYPEFKSEYFRTEFDRYAAPQLEASSSAEQDAQADRPPS
jgi:hypothetical protein